MLALKAFSHTATYDTAIAEYLQGEIGEILQNSFNFFEPNVDVY
jgi:AICAR transformylase/IMP cyclohydrolase PurH